ncbi:hypothetical protein BC833DRAFT_90171 [Globomyces pollinis-pini]|nr:hypothetical protein BC833DRAFT_90171 [Globomyces pollinis-pini]
MVSNYHKLDNLSDYQTLDQYDIIHYPTKDENTKYYAIKRKGIKVLYIIYQYHTVFIHKSSFHGPCMSCYRNVGYRWEVLEYHDDQTQSSFYIDLSKHDTKAKFLGSNGIQYAWHLFPEKSFFGLLVYPQKIPIAYIDSNIPDIKNCIGQLNFIHECKNIQLLVRTAGVLLIDCLLNTQSPSNGNRKSLFFCQ